MDEDWPPSREWLNTALEGGEITQEQYDAWTQPPQMTPRHAYYAGMIVGIARRHGVTLLPVMENGVVTDRVTLTFADDQVITFVIPPPPDDWQPDG